MRDRKLSTNEGEHILNFLILGVNYPLTSSLIDKRRLIQTIRTGKFIKNALHWSKINQSITAKSASMSVLDIAYYSTQTLHHVQEKPYARIIST